MQLVIFSKQQWCVRKTKFFSDFYKTQTLIPLFHAKNKTKQNKTETPYLPSQAKKPCPSLEVLKRNNPLQKSDSPLVD